MNTITLYRVRANVNGAWVERYFTTEAQAIAFGESFIRGNRVRGGYSISTSTI